MACMELPPSFTVLGAFQSIHSGRKPLKGSSVECCCHLVDHDDILKSSVFFNGYEVCTQNRICAFG